MGFLWPSSLTFITELSPWELPQIIIVLSTLLCYTVEREKGEGKERNEVKQDGVLKSKNFWSDPLFMEGAY